MRTIRFLLFGLFPLVAISCLIGGEVRQSLVKTGDWRDLTVVGPGYFCTLDEDGNREWYRSIRLGTDFNGTLCANVNGVLRPLDPTITMPMLCDRIEISQTGEVWYTADGDAQTLPYATLLVERLGSVDNTDVNQYNDPDATRLVCEPGQSGAGYLMQQAAFQYCLPLTNKVVAGCGFAMAWVGMVVRTIWREKQSLSTAR